MVSAPFTSAIVRSQRAGNARRRDGAGRKSAASVSETAKIASFAGRARRTRARATAAAAAASTRGAATPPLGTVPRTTSSAAFKTSNSTVCVSASSTTLSVGAALQVRALGAGHSMGTVPRQATKPHQAVPAILHRRLLTLRLRLPLGIPAAPLRRTSTADSQRMLPPRLAPGKPLRDRCHPILLARLCALCHRTRHPVLTLNALCRRTRLVLTLNVQYRRIRTLWVFPAQSHLIRIPWAVPARCLPTNLAYSVRPPHVQVGISTPEAMLWKASSVAWVPGPPAPPLARTARRRPLQPTRAWLRLDMVRR